MKTNIEPIRRMTWLAWSRQIEEECRVWASASGDGAREPKIIDAYLAGVREGCRQAMSTLKLHNHVAVLD